MSKKIGRPVNTIENITKNLIKQESGCWFWNRRLSVDGYGEVSWNDKTKQVHRLMYEETRGPIEKGLLVRHTCSKNYPIDSIDYRKCCNPDHLILGTPAENSQDMINEGRQKLPSTAWKPGAMAGENNTTAVLTWDIVNDLRSRERKYGDVKKWAEEFNISTRSILNVLAGRTWNY